MESLNIEKNVKLAALTWWKVGGEADYFAQPATIDEVLRLMEWSAKQSLPLTVLGGGSNVLISDRGIEGLVLSTKKLASCQLREENARLTLDVLAGTPKAELTKNFLKYKLAPALFLCGLPGDVGGGIVMNAGVGEMILPREFVEIVDEVEVARLDTTGKAATIIFRRDQLRWHYRHSEGWQPGVVVRAKISWPLEADIEIGDKVKRATKARLEKQPLNLPSCGSVFKNPTGDKSGRLIEAAGLKGFTIGGAQVSTKHANFIVNFEGKAIAADCDAVIQYVRKTVLEKFGVELQAEVKYLGRW